jgi:hypothetical protein
VSIVAVGTRIAALLVAALTVVGGALLIGKAGAAGNAAATTRGTVAFVGDSNLLYGGTALDLTLADRGESYIVVNSSRSGATIRSHGGAYWRSRLAALNESVTADSYVINLGINDTIAPGTETTNGYAAYGKKIDWLLGQLEPSVPVIWSNLPCEVEPVQRAKGCAVVNKALSAAGARHANLTIADWATTANGHPEWLTGIHYTSRGAGEYARLIWRTIAALP